MQINPLAGVQGTNQVDPVKQKEEQAALLDACQQFESIFINMMLKQMRSTVEAGSLVEKSQAQEIYESMHDEALAEEMTKGRGIGLAQQMYKQLITYYSRPESGG